MYFNIDFIKFYRRINVVFWCYFGYFLYEYVFYLIDLIKIVKIYLLYWRFREIENSVNINDKKIDLLVFDSLWFDENKVDFKGNDVWVNVIIIFNKFCKNMFF